MSSNEEGAGDMWVTRTPLREMQLFFGSRVFRIINLIASKWKYLYNELKHAYNLHVNFIQRYFYCFISCLIIL